MLENIRGIAHNKLFKVFFFILAAIFAVSLGNFSRTSNTENIIATVGKEKISLAELKKARQTEINNLNNMRHLSAEQAQSIAGEINRVALNKLVTQSLIKQEMKHLGIIIPDEVVAEYIHTDPSFQKDGAFDPVLYKELLKQNNLNEDVLLKTVAQQVASRFLINSLTTNLPLKSLIVGYVKNFLLEERDVSIITLDGSKLDFLEADPNKLKEFYTNNAAFFQGKEYRMFNYIYFDSQDNKINKEQISEQDLKQEYDQNKAEYAVPEKRDFYHFLTPDEGVAKELAETLKSDSDHVRVAKSFVNKKVINEFFANQSQDSFLNSIDNTIFLKSENEITQAIKSDLGWHVFKIVKIHPQSYQDFSKIKNIIRDNLYRKLVQQKIFELSKQVEDEIGSGADFDEVATRFGGKIVKVNGVDNSGSDDNLQKININSKIVATAFETEVGEDSGVKMLDDFSGFYIVKLEKIIDSKLIDFEKVKDKVKSLYIEDLRNKIATQAASLISLNLNKSGQTIFSAENSSLNIKELDAIFKEQFSKMALKNLKFDISLKKVKIKRNGEGSENLPTPAVNGIFSTELNKATMPFNIGQGKFIIALATSSSIPESKNNDLVKQADYMSESNYKGEILDQYLEYLKKKFPVKFNLSLIDKSE